MLDHGAEASDGATAGQYRVTRGWAFHRAVEVQQYQHPRRFAEIMHPRDGLLPPIAAFVQVDRRTDPTHLVGNGALVGVDA